MTIREATLFVLQIRGKPPLVVSDAPVMGSFNRMAIYKPVSVVKTYENGVKESVFAFKQDCNILVNPAEVVFYHEIKCDVVE